MRKKSHQVSARSVEVYLVNGVRYGLSYLVLIILCFASSPIWANDAVRFAYARSVKTTGDRSAGGELVYFEESGAVVESIVAGKRELTIHQFVILKKVCGDDVVRPEDLRVTSCPLEFSGTHGDELRFPELFRSSGSFPYVAMKIELLTQRCEGASPLKENELAVILLSNRPHNRLFAIHWNAEYQERIGTLDGPLSGRNAEESFGGRMHRIVDKMSGELNESSYEICNVIDKELFFKEGGDSYANRRNDIRTMLETSRSVITVDKITLRSVRSAEFRNLLLAKETNEFIKKVNKDRDASVRGSK